MTTDPPGAGDIFRRAFASRVYPSSVLAKMGLMHVRGVLLFGAPGCVHLTEMCSGSEAGSYLRLIDSCITQVRQDPHRPQDWQDACRQRAQGLNTSMTYDLFRGGPVPIRSSHKPPPPPSSPATASVAPPVPRAGVSARGWAGWGVLNFRTTPLQKCESVPRRARI